MASNRSLTANSPRFVSVAGVKKTGRGYASAKLSLGATDVNDPEKLIQAFNAIHNRLSELEKTKPAEYIDFELDCKTTGTVQCQHNFNAPVRFTLVHWKGSAAPTLNQNEAASTANLLVLNSTVQGRAIVRVERAQQTPTAGGFGT